MQCNEVAALMGVDQINDTALFDVVEGAEPVKLSEAEWSISVVDDETYSEKTLDAKIQYIPGLGGWCLDPFTPNTYDDEPDEEEAEPAKQEAPFFMVSVYLVDRAYGGPEEGGWYYDTGEPVAEEGLPLLVVCSTRISAATSFHCICLLLVMLGHDWPVADVCKYKECPVSCLAGFNNLLDDNEKRYCPTYSDRLRQTMRL